MGRADLADGADMITGRYTQSTELAAGRGKITTRAERRGLSLAALRGLEAWDALEDDRQCATDHARGVLGAAGLRALLS